MTALPNTEIAADRVTIAGKPFFTQNGVARELKKSKRTVARWAATRTGPPRIVIGRMVLYDPDKLLDWLTRHEQKPLRQARRA